MQGSGMSVMQQQQQVHWDEASKHFYRYDPVTRGIVWIHPSALAAPPPTFIVPLGPPVTVVVDYPLLSANGRVDEAAVATAVGARYLQRYT
ncbi:hypothetical protein HDU67_009402 [Dinochytrium kinnereticum]|nr:hypothetical protein HDU67_009402 [Dinochytrium kinnereticum]